MDPISIEQREDFREHLTLGLVSAIGRFFVSLSIEKHLWSFFKYEGKQQSLI
jgi:hypothetical protein